MSSNSKRKNDADADYLDSLHEQKEKGRIEGVRQVLQDPVGAQLFQAFLSQHKPRQGEFDTMFANVDRICDETKKMYKTTKATASECLTYLDEELLKIGMEPDCVSLWQTFRDMAEQEKEWDDLTPEQQQAKETNVPKGMSRKKVDKKSKGKSSRTKVPKTSK